MSKILVYEVTPEGRWITCPVDACTRGWISFEYEAETFCELLSRLHHAHPEVAPDVLAQAIRGADLARPKTERRQPRRLPRRKRRA